jgi:nitrous oxidase accessory protein
MDKKYGLLVLCSVLLLACFVGSACAKTWYVDDGGAANFTRIQDAVDNATTGDTIIVSDGTYIENVDIYVKNLTIKSGNGSASTIVRAANSNDHVFEVRADYVAISGFTVRGADELFSAGIYLYSANNCNISNNNASNNCDGIYLSSSSNNNTLMGNTVSNNGWWGICLWPSSTNSISSNTVSNNGLNGISLYSSSTNNTLTGNTANSNNYYGISLDSSSTNTLTGNTASDNDYGIFLWNSSDNQIFINNFMNNSDNAYSNNSTNIWNSTEQIAYWYNGNTFTNQLGNYWDDFVERYPNAEEKDSAGIWNTPYEIDGGRDKYPLMEPFENYIM